jgi:predicted lipid-binding transport protein (Tim44 family)
VVNPKERSVTKFLTMLIALLSLTFAFDADARRFGGAKTIGKQREAISQQQAAPKAPAPQQPTASGTTSTPTQQPAGAGKWLGPLTGLALGAGLAALFLHNGISGLLAGLLMIGLIIAAAVYVARLVRGRTASAPMQYAGAGVNDSKEPTRIEPAFGGPAPRSVAAMSRWPAGFDATEFVRHAKLNFVRMQATHDQKDLAAIRDFVTPELYPEIEADVRAVGDNNQQTEVVTLNAEVLDVATEADLYVVSVRFSGLIREAAGEEPQPFNEIWHLEKPVAGGSGWLVAGIQQD